MQTITRSELQQHLQDDPNVALIEVLPEEAYRKFHLPGAINVPVNDDDFEQKMRKAAPQKNWPVIVYCRDADCDASVKAAERLESLGYEKVMDYGAGKDDWREAGLPVA